MFGYRVPAPDQAMLISGGRAAGNAPFRVVTGHGAYIMPFFRKVRFLTLAKALSVPRNGSCLTKTRWRSSRGASSPVTCARSSAR